jgi:response regulator of citrate/malate metabolism
VPERLGVLVVEDDPMVAALHDRWLRAAGLDRVAIAYSAPEGIAAVRRGGVDLVILDLGLPGADGLEVLEAIRRARVDVDVVVVTARRDNASIRTALRLGAVDYLVKPFEQARFNTALSAVLARRSLLGRSHLQQRDVDRLTKQPATVARATPAGIAPSTLDRVRTALVEAGQADAADTAANVGLSRVVARRYLEHLVTNGEAECAEAYGGSGRPRKIYRCIR